MKKILENSTKKFKFNQEISIEEQFEIMLRINPIIEDYLSMKVFDEVGYFDENFIMEDKLYLKVLKKGIRIHFFNERPVYTSNSFRIYF